MIIYVHNYHNTGINGTDRLFLGSEPGMFFSFLSGEPSSKMNKRCNEWQMWDSNPNITEKCSTWKGCFFDVNVFTGLVAFRNLSCWDGIILTQVFRAESARYSPGLSNCGAACNLSAFDSKKSVHAHHVLHFREAFTKSIVYEGK